MGKKDITKTSAKNDRVRTFKIQFLHKGTITLAKMFGINSFRTLKINQRLKKSKEHLYKKSG